MSALVSHQGRIHFGERSNLGGARSVERAKQPVKVGQVPESDFVGNSGALLLAKAGLLAGLHATTHHGALAELREDDETITSIAPRGSSIMAKSFFRQAYLPASTPRSICWASYMGRTRRPKRQPTWNMIGDIEMWIVAQSYGTDNESRELRLNAVGLIEGQQVIRLRT